MPDSVAVQPTDITQLSLLADDERASSCNTECGRQVDDANWDGEVGGSHAAKSD